MKKLLCSALCIVFLQGCAPAMLIGAVGYAVSSGRKSHAEMLSAYSDYRVKMETLNTQREKDGLSLLPISTYEEWYKFSKGGK